MRVFELMDKLANMPAGAVVEVITNMSPKDLYRDGLVNDGQEDHPDDVVYEMSFAAKDAVSEYTDEGKRVYIYAAPIGRKEESGCESA